MRQEARGQSIIEYVAVAVIIMMALMVMGPFLKNSVNAHFKMLDESVNDAANEYFR